jgi:hypothetical protein
LHRESFSKRAAAPATIPAQTENSVDVSSEPNAKSGAAPNSLRPLGRRSSCAKGGRTVLVLEDYGAEYNIQR